ncbi:MAG: phospho-sugar mutase [Lachnospiraceae bacterium]|nr:phospho-sugar mutase [Lachnospiraceae bacterium]
MNYLQKYKEWLDRLPAGDPLREELLAIAGDDSGIRERFERDIEFGTAGLRGICSAGTDRMNERTVGRATQGIANYILKAGQEAASRGAVIAYDCRYHSKEFSELSARILAGNGIKSYLFPEMRPTPELSYAVRKLGAAAGINMTASHNPKEYNGYKVYWEDGAQIFGEVADGIQAEIATLTFLDPFREMSLEEAGEKGLLTVLGEEMDRSYLDYVKSMRQRPESELDRTVPVVYTPLHGAGSIPMRRLAAEEGYTGFHIVEAQQDPDPEFSTVGYPNPEDPKGFAMAEELGKAVKAEVLIATDPDSDRMAIEIPDGKGGYTPLNGNQTGALLIAYMAQSMKEKGTLPEKAAMIKSIVTGNMGRAICEAYGIRVYETLTGFKNICGVIPKAEKEGYTYFFGYEESIGCAPGAQVRDKDGICAGMLIMEMAAWLRKKGMTIGSYLESLYKRYGYYREYQKSFTLSGLDGMKKIGDTMRAFRAEKCMRFGDFEVERIIDYLHGYEDIPPSNVLSYRMTDGSWFAVRPSGTEPKIKFYFYTKSAVREEAERSLAALREAVLRRTGLL